MFKSKRKLVKFLKQKQLFCPVKLLFPMIFEEICLEKLLEKFPVKLPFPSIFEEICLEEILNFDE